MRTLSTEQADARDGTEYIHHSGLLDITVPGVRDTVNCETYPEEATSTAEDPADKNKQQLHVALVQATRPSKRLRERDSSKREICPTR